MTYRPLTLSARLPANTQIEDCDRLARALASDEAVLAVIGFERRFAFYVTFVVDAPEGASNAGPLIKAVSTLNSHLWQLGTIAANDVTVVEGDVGADVRPTAAEAVAHHERPRQPRRPAGRMPQLAVLEGYLPMLAPGEVERLLAELRAIPDFTRVDIGRRRADGRQHVQVAIRMPSDLHPAAVRDWVDGLVVGAMVRSLAVCGQPITHGGMSIIGYEDSPHDRALKALDELAEACGELSFPPRGFSLEPFTATQLHGRHFDRIRQTILAHEREHDPVSAGIRGQLAAAQVPPQPATGG